VGTAPAGVQHRAMDTARTEPEAPTPAPTTGKHRNPWIWISALLALVAVGLLVWALSTRSDLDDTEAQVDDLQTQVDQQAEAGGDFATAAKAAYDELAANVGEASANAQATVEAAQADVDEAEQQVEAAKAEAEAAGDDAAAQAEAAADQARAEADAATSKAAIVGECAKAYVSAFGALFEGNARDAAAAVREQLAGITDDCQAALAGS
jgi:hypothetical protein